MNYWRMAMREGTGGTDRFPDCYERGIAALDYWYRPGRRVVTDCRKLTRDQFHEAWRRLLPRNTSGRKSLEWVAYEMREGDVIYARNGPYIVGRGIVSGEYEYDPSILADIAEGGEYWAHYVRVRWDPDFRQIRLPLKPWQWTVFPLSKEQISSIRAGERKAGVASKSRSGKGRSRRTHSGGGGFASSEANRQVECAAIDAVTGWFRSKHWRVTSREADRCGYDLECRRHGETLHVEVKGTSAGVEQFIITSGELRRAKRDPEFLLCVVTDALTDQPTITDYYRNDVSTHFDLSPLQYRAVPK